MARYNFLVVGGGLFGATFARQALEAGKSCLVIDKRPHVAGNVYSERTEGVDVHKYGPHIFHTNSEPIWNYANRFGKFNRYTHRVKVNYRNNLYSFPINLQTMYEVYGCKTPGEASAKLDEVRVKIDRPKNLEEHCLSQVGPDLYETFVRGYTAKQWGKDPRDLPASIIKRLPVRLTFDDRYHDAVYSGIPDDGYTPWVRNMLDGIPVELGVDFSSLDWRRYADRVVYSGKIDALYDYCFGELEYRSLEFETKTLDGDYQGVAQVNYTEESVPYTRVTEHKYFNDRGQKKTVVTWEYPAASGEPYYPVGDDKNKALYARYAKLADGRFVVGGRLGRFSYLNMDQVIAGAIKAATAACGRSEAVLAPLDPG